MTDVSGTGEYHAFFDETYAGKFPSRFPRLNTHLIAHIAALGAEILVAEEEAGLIGLLLGKGNFSPSILQSADSVQTVRLVWRRKGGMEVGGGEGDFLVWQEIRLPILSFLLLISLVEPEKKKMILFLFENK